MATKPRIFISAVSAEFRQTRQMIAQVLLRLGYDPFWQDILSTEAGDLREMLKKKIDSCDGVLQIVGYAYGYEPEKIDLDYGRISYTQFELAYARKIGKKIWVVFAGDDCTRDTPIDQLNLPPEDDHPKPQAYQAERRKLQAAWREKIKRTGDLHHEAPDDRELELLIERMKDDMHEMLRSERIWRRAILGGIAAVLLLAVTAVGMIGSMRGDQDQQKQDFEDLKELAVNDIGIPFKDVTQEDIMPELKQFDSTAQSVGYGLRWYFVVATSPRAAKTITHLNVKSFYSLDGHEYKEGMDARNIYVQDAMGHDSLFLKFRSFNGEEIGPFEYPMDFEEYVMRDYREKLENARNLINGQGRTGQIMWQWGYTCKTWFPAVERVEFAFTKDMKSNQTIDIPAADFANYFSNEWEASLSDLLSPITPAKSAGNEIFYRFVYRNGEVGKLKNEKFTPRSGLPRRTGSSFSSPPEVAFEDLKKDDLEVKLWTYDRTLGWGIQFKFPQGIQHESRDPENGVLVDYSFDGETFESAYSDSIHILNKETADHKKLFLKLTSQSGETVGPFEFKADFLNTALDSLRENLDRAIQRPDSNSFIQDLGNVIGIGSFLGESFPLISRVEFSFDKSLKEKTTLTVPEARFKEYQDSEWRSLHKLNEYYDVPGGVKQVYFRLTFRDGSTSKILQQKINGIGGGGLGGGN